jgi:hypothetical protein
VMFDDGLIFCYGVFIYMSWRTRRKRWVHQTGKWILQ